VAQLSSASAPKRRPRAIALLSITLLLLAALAAPAVWSIDGAAAAAIEIDGTKAADLYPGNNTCAKPFTGNALDWVKDCSATVANPKLVADPGTVTGKSGATGNWNGVRIVDGINGGDNDIFLTGGKENDTSTWNVGPGTVGSSKYDATQAYLANTQSELFFGMERRGNNGTTAFDFEFNQKAPAAGENYIPTRTVDDVLLTFVLNGSGNTGSAEAHYFTWSGAAYVEQPLPASAKASINDSQNTPSAPWGHVNSKGVWDGSDLSRFEFGESSVPLSVLPGVDACGGRAYVQLRTRSSATDTSDLKDATKIFEYEFPSITVTAAKQNPNATDQSVEVAATATGATGLTYEWEKSHNGTAWSAIAGASSDTLTYSSFEADDPSPSATGAFSIASGDGSGNYVGKVYTVLIRVTAKKAVANTTCKGTSAPVTVKKVLAVDP